MSEYESYQTGTQFRTPDIAIDRHAEVTRSDPAVARCLPNALERFDSIVRMGALELDTDRFADGERNDI